MIDAKELRIGNCILLRGAPVMVAGIPNLYKLLILGEQYAVEVEKFGPIPLTEELLLKCCFAYNSIDDCFDGLNLRVRIFGDSICAFIGFEVASGKKWYDANLEVKSLHQLQNIYFDLTGKELEIPL